ncbi:ABC transporter permease, partial [Geobacillus sp. MMMUD3]|nr:ABC transporter permease [Geobacillus sp. MMMUD3]
IDVRLRGKPGTASARTGRGSGRGGARSSTARSAVTATDPTTKEALAASASSVGVTLDWAERSAVGPADSSAAGGPGTSAQDAAEPGRALNGKRTP